MTFDDIDRILGDFREWLYRRPTSMPTLDAENSPSVDLATVVREFVALRQEVNLQTRASRTQNEQTARAIELLEKANESVDDDEDADVEDDRTKPFLKLLVETRDALALAQKHVVKARAATVVDAPPLELPRLPAWFHWVGLDRAVNRSLRPIRDWVQGIADSRGQVDSLIVGYSMSLQRLDRALQQFGLESLDSAGQPFDPETMEAIEVVAVPGKTLSEVIEVVRPGYRLKGQLFRCAQVRVARPA